MRHGLRILTAALLCAAPLHAPLHAQLIRGVVRDSASGAPIAGAVILLLGADGGTLDRELTDVQGMFAVGPASAAQRLRVLRMGFRPREVALGAQPIHVAMTRLTSMIEAVNVTASSCSRRPDRVPAMAIYEYARDGLLAMVVARQKRGNFLVLRYEQTLEGTSDRVVRNVVRVDSTTRSSVSFSAARGAHDFVQAGFGRQQPDGFEFLAPDADVLLDASFAQGYCFHLETARKDRPNQIGLGFAAARPARDRVDVDGVLWVDTTTRSLRDIEFRYVQLDPVLERFRPGGSITFEEMSNGTVLISRWALRLVGTRIDTVEERRRGGWVEKVAATRFIASVAGGELAAARWRDGAFYQAPLGRLRITARTGERPAAGVRFQLPLTPYYATTDSTGAADIGNLVPGPYELEMSDSSLRELDLTIPSGVRFTAVRDSTHAVEVAVPSVAQFIEQRCVAAGGRSEPQAGYLLARVVDRYGGPLDKVDWIVTKAALNARSYEAPWQGKTDSDGLIHVCSARLEPGARVAITIPLKSGPPILKQLTVSDRVTLARIEVDR